MCFVHVIGPTQLHSVFINYNINTFILLPTCILNILNRIQHQLETIVIGYATDDLLLINIYQYPHNIETIKIDNSYIFVNKPVWVTIEIDFRTNIHILEKGKVTKTSKVTIFRLLCF